jgi:hypothetical protein
MKDLDKTIRKAFKAEIDLWKSIRDLQKSKGMDIEELLLFWASQEAQRLPSPGARQDFVELCNDGCLPAVLAPIITLLRYSPGLEAIWSEMIGSRAKRQKATHALEKAASLLERSFAGLPGEPEKELEAQFSGLGRLLPSRLVAELRFYVRFFNLAASLKADTRAHSLADVAKYLLTSYVKLMTRRFHDRNVSGLVGAISGHKYYSEVDQRMWRARNYKRLDHHFSWITRILFAATVSIVYSK